MGIDKLELSEGQISLMQNDLQLMKPKLLKTSQETEILIKKIEMDAKEVDAVRCNIEIEKELVNKAAVDAQLIKDECEEKLESAMPALNEAISALDTLKQQDITMVKSMTNPPPGVRLVLECICIMKGIKPEKKVDKNGKQFDDFWIVSKKVCQSRQHINAHILHNVSLCFVRCSAKCDFWIASRNTTRTIAIRR
jgi:dynein heavy chain